jgi:hypothetical protein
MRTTGMIDIAACGMTKIYVHQLDSPQSTMLALVIDSLIAERQVIYSLQLVSRLVGVPFIVIPGAFLLVYLVVV